MKRTGERLRTSREEQRLTISEVSLSTKINPRVLQAMEDGNLDKLPAVSFLRGFIRTYATYLKLDANELLELFTKEVAELRPPPVVPNEAAAANANPTAGPSPESSPKARPAPQTLRESSAASRSLVAGGVVLLIVIILGIKQIVDKYEREGSVDAPPQDIERLVHENENPPVTPSPADSTTKTPDATKTPEGTPAPTAEAPAPTEPTGEPTKETKKVETPPTPPPAAPPATPPPPVVAPAKPVETPKPVEVTKPVETAKPAEPPKPNETAKPVEPPKPAEVAKPPEPPVATPEAAKPPKSGNPQEVIIEALDQVEVSFRIDGGRLETVVLKPEQVHTLKGNGSLAIDFSDGGAVNLIHNGIDKGVPGDLGKPKKIKFP